MITLCTLFDINYYTKGACLAASIRRHVPNAVLYILALDDATHERLDDLGERGMIPIALHEIESPELLQAKGNRTYKEYVWTLASNFTLWCYERFTPQSIAYIDADCFFFSDPTPIYNEVAKFPVAITPHRFTPSEESRLSGAGTYNVGWTWFNRDGYPCLRHWARQCLEWCKYDVMQDGRFADQGYLNDWPAKWGAYPVPHLGFNLAPWNQAQYEYNLVDGRLVISDWQDTDPLIMYHFHGFEGIGKRTGYRLRPMVTKHVYEPYEAEYTKWMT